MYRIKIIICVVSVLFGLAVTGCQKSEQGEFQDISLEKADEEGASVEGDTEESRSEKITESMIFVHVCGAVKMPGVYELKEGSRVFEAVKAAGGVLDEAMAEGVNQAEVLLDGQQLYIPFLSDSEEGSLEKGIRSDGKININKAAKEELMTLSGIGEAKAEAIIRYRQEQGDFKSIEEIMEIEGIKEGVFRKIKDQITVS